MNGSHVEIEELIAAYAVHALDVSERAQVQTEILEHIAGCDACRTLFRDLNDLSGELALAAPPAGVSEGLEDRIMNAARGERPATARKAPSARWPLRVASAAAAAVVIALAIWNVQLGSTLRQEQSQTRVAIRAMALLGDPSAQHARLAGSPGSVTLAVRSDGSVAMAASGLPALPKGRVYELWLLSNGNPVPATVFTPEDGIAIATLRLAGSYDAAAITIEKGPNGSTRPTGGLLYNGSLTG